MKNLGAFIFTTLNGFFEGSEKGDISWHRHGQEENEFAASSMQPGTILVFGRVTYEMMVRFWPTPMAMQNAPDVARGMNSARKIVFSHSMEKADWENTTLIKEDVVSAVKKLKKTSEHHMTILGSGSIVRQLSEAGLIDEYHIMIDPVALGKGMSVFQGLSVPLNLDLINVRSFKSGTVLLDYKPVRRAD